jgi:hypothetical protein
MKISLLLSLVMPLSFYIARIENIKPLAQPVS